MLKIWHQFVLSNCWSPQAKDIYKRYYSIAKIFFKKLSFASKVRLQSLAWNLWRMRMPHTQAFQATEIGREGGGGRGSDTQWSLNCPGHPHTVTPPRKTWKWLVGSIRGLKNSLVYDSCYNIFHPSLSSPSLSLPHTHLHGLSLSHTHTFSLCVSS